VQRRDGRTTLALGEGIVAVAMPHALAREVVADLARSDALGPVLVMKVEQQQCWVFLADPNGVVASADLLPSGVVVLGCPARVPLPASDTISHDVSWAVPPDSCRRWLPTLAAILCAARYPGA